MLTDLIDHPHLPMTGALLLLNGQFQPSWAVSALSERNLKPHGVLSAVTGHSPILTGQFQSSEGRIRRPDWGSKRVLMCASRATAAFA